jgi:hypothetical protein
VLDLSCNPLREKGHQILAEELLPKTVTLAVLNLASTGLTSVGTKSLADGLMKKNSVTALYLQTTGGGSYRN